MTLDSQDALVAAVETELAKRARSPLHGEINISWTVSESQNGISRCDVQVECKAGCGYLIMAFDDEAMLLNGAALALKRILEHGCSKNYVLSILGIQQEAARSAIPYGS